MKRTPLYQEHIEAGASMAPFAGWEMPLSYKGTVAEVAAVRARAGIFDVSHMGEFRVSGPDAAAYLQQATTNDIRRLRPGRAQYSLLLNEEGGVVDDIIVYHLPLDGPAEYLVVVNAGCKDKDWAWLGSAASGMDVRLVDESDFTALIAVQGPLALGIASDLFGQDLSGIKRFEAAWAMYRGIPILASRTGYTGEDGLELFSSNEGAEALWRAFTAAAVVPAGLGARDVLRLEAAYSLYGHELDEAHSPWESGVGWAVKLDKGTFIGGVASRKELADHLLVGLRMDERAIPREGYAVCTPRLEECGRVTSGTFSPTLTAGIALARVNKASVSEAHLTVDIRGRVVPAHIVDLPFYRNGV